MLNKALIFDIQKGSIVDGPGIRTTVFLKGCPLRCKWCHNPESWENRQELSYNSDKCVSCYACLDVCKFGVHHFTENDKTVLHTVNRSMCTYCGACVKNCYYDALKIIGREYTVKEIMEDIVSDKNFYDESGGGVTLSGGEPFMQFEFILELLKALKDLGIHTCVETSGYCTNDKIAKAAEYIDLFLYDFKETDSELHKAYTGVDNILILSNLRLLNKLGKSIILRCPIIPDYNARGDHFKGIGALADSLQNLVEINIEPYHSMGISKFYNLGKEPPFKRKELIEKETLNYYYEQINNFTDKKVVIV